MVKKNSEGEKLIRISMHALKSKSQTILLNRLFSIFLLLLDWARCIRLD